MADSVTGGGLHWKDLSKADVSLNIYSFKKAQETGEIVNICCAIGDEEVCGISYSKIVEDAKEKMLLLLEMNREFRDKFTAIIDLPPYTNTDLVSFAKSYAKEKEYTIEEMGILALYSKLAEMQFETDFIPTLYNVKELIDEAIEKVGKRKVKSAFGKLFSKRKEVNQGKVLKEKDFI